MSLEQNYIDSWKEDTELIQVLERMSVALTNLIKIVEADIEIIAQDKLLDVEYMKLYLQDLIVKLFTLLIKETSALQQTIKEKMTE